MHRLILISLLLSSCSTATHDFPIDFPNRMPEGLFQNNLRDCRSQPQCSADQLFDRW
jgi:hypothetical protein